MDPIEFFGVVRTGGEQRFVSPHLVRPPAAGYPAGARVIVGVMVDPAQPAYVAPFTLLELPTDDGWRTELWQPAEIQRGRLPEEAGGTENEADELSLPRPSKLLGFEHLRPLPPDLPQPFLLD